MAKKIKKSKGKLVKLLLIEILILLLLLGGYKIYSTLKKINFDNSQDGNILTNLFPDENQKGYRNIAIFGVDSRDNKLDKDTHSDAIMVASINNKSKDVKLVSIYRDTYSNIPGYDFDKITHAYFKGGYALSLSTINTNFDLNVTEYITVNFKALVNTIDSLGGIELDITDAELKYLNGYVRELNKINGSSVGKLKSAGKQTVNGTQATAYARIRYTKGGDFKRAERQRIVISKMLDKVKATDKVKVLSIIDDIFPQVYTNLTSTEILKLAKSFASYNIVGETGFPFEKDAHTYKKVSYVFPINLEENVIKLQEFLFENETYEPSSTVKEYSKYIESIRTQK
ncbi:MAG TPA: LCP family protein [Clostridiales bacterium]|nr:LCP family protein [Clostridiales bacterium]